MKMLLKMAGRNLLRHRRRTLLTFLALSFSAMIYVFYGCMLDGFTKQSFENMIAFESGHIRIADRAEEKDPLSLSNCLPAKRVQSIRKTLSQITAIRSHTARLHFRGEIDNSRDAAPCTITGLDPATDPGVFPLHKLVQLSLLSSNTAIMGKNLAADLGLRRGDSFNLTFRRSSGMLDSTAFFLAAVISSGYSEIDGDTVFLSLKTAQRISGAAGPGEINLYLNNPEMSIRTAAQLRRRLPGLRVQSWEQAGTGIVAMSEAKKKGSGAFVLFLSCIALVGIINTMLMSVLEKRQEIGTLKALGMKEGDIRMLFLIEGTILGFIGAVAGVIMGALANIYFAVEGLNLQAIIGSIGSNIGFKLMGNIRSTWDPSTFLTAFFVCILVSAAASWLPARRAVKLEAAEALRTIQ